MNQSVAEKNKTLVLHAFETLFNKRDYAGAERYWSPNISSIARIFRLDARDFSTW